MDTIAREVGARGYNEREAGERSASPLGKVFFRSTLQTIFDIPSPADRRSALMMAVGTRWIR